MCGSAGARALIWVHEAARTCVCVFVCFCVFVCVCKRKCVVSRGFVHYGLFVWDTSVKPNIKEMGWPTLAISLSHCCIFATCL